ncbi:MAG TPA: FAD-dependent oxidoreductase, partial [Ignisphaera sp.]|nr:FAD-dependent oxidoreductase [Ignisphaera sp.]
MGLRLGVGENMERIRVVIIGAGIIGASIARILSMFENLEIHLVEKEPDVGWGVSRANTALIHGCYTEDPDKHPLRAKLCIEGAKLWRHWIRELDIPAEFPGALVIAFTPDEMEILYTLLDNGVKNKVPSLTLIENRDQLEFLEPNISSNAIGALWSPSVGFL